MALEFQMNCFEWQNHTSDYLDGTLSEAAKRDSDEHIETCKDCNEKYKHYRVILSSIANQPRTTLPPQIRKAPLSAALPRIEPSKFSFSNWELIPWYFRTLLEATGIILGVLLLVSSAPRIRTLYETSFEKTLSDFRESLNVSEANLDKENQQLPPLQSAGAKPAMDKATSMDELSGEDDSDAEESIHVGRSELWRFTIKTVSPDEFRPQVVKVLTGLGVSDKTPGLGGTQVPGGIEFDFVLPESMVAHIKHSLQALAPASPEQQEHPGSENFTWYRVKSKRKIPEGKSQVVIWLSQPH
jgi:hypothetical protein